MAIISVDGHVKAPRAGFREYIEHPYLADFDDWLRSEEESGLPDAGNLHPTFDVDAQWDSDHRLHALESQGVVAEVLFPNGMPFQRRRFDDAGRAANPELTRQAQLAYNRWLADFCAQTPGRRAGQALVSFDDVDQAVADIRWAKAHGLGGIMMPALVPGGTFFFDSVLDPVWAACQDLGLPMSQHGGAGAPEYTPPGFAAIMSLALEHSFFSGRSLWQLMLGGVFDRFPDLRLAFVETQVWWIAPMINQLNDMLSLGDDWLGFARLMQREREFSRSPEEYWASNCRAGVSPFTVAQIEIEELAVKDARPAPRFHIRSDQMMFGVDYPHFESIVPHTMEHVAELVGHPSVPEADARKILYENAAQTYDFDLTALQPHIDRVGFDVSELVAAT